MGPSGLNKPSTRRLALYFTSSYWFSSNYTHLTCCNFICQHSAITKTTVPISIYLVRLQLGKPRFVGISAIFSCDQASLWMVQSVLLSVCLSVCLSVRLSHLFDYVTNIVSWNFQELLPMTKVMSMQKVKVRGQSSRSQRSKPHIAVSRP